MSNTLFTLSTLIDTLERRYDQARMRQEPDTKRPSGYMRGLREAINVTKSFEGRLKNNESR